MRDKESPGSSTDRFAEIFMGQQICRAIFDFSLAAFELLFVGTERRSLESRNQVRRQSDPILGGEMVDFLDELTQGFHANSFDFSVSGVNLEATRLGPGSSS